MLCRVVRIGSQCSNSVAVQPVRSPFAPCTVVSHGSAIRRSHRRCRPLREDNTPRHSCSAHGCRNSGAPECSGAEYGAPVETQAHHAVPQPGSWSDRFACARLQPLRGNKWRKDCNQTRQQESPAKSLVSYRDHALKVVLRQIELTDSGASAIQRVPGTVESDGS